MDKSQQIKRIRALVESLKNANAELNDQDMLDDEDRVLQEQIIGDGQDLITYMLQAEHPAHPAIPEEVRKTIHAALCRVGGPDVRNARDWLAKCPQASDKAVCPKCGCKMTAKRVLESSSEWIPGTHRIDCVGCKEEFEITVAPLTVISPPREPKKGTP